MVAARAKRQGDDFAGLRKGMLEFALLRMIGAEKLYAGEIEKRLGATPFKAPRGTLYPLLGKMRRAGLIDHEWKESAAGPPRKYYSLTKSGVQKLDALITHWKAITTALSDLSR